MRFPWQPREYERTCAACGYTWRVPRSAARRRVTSINMISVAGRSSLDRAEMDREKAAIAAGNQPAEVYRHCPSAARTSSPSGLCADRREDAPAQDDDPGRGGPR